MQRYFYLLCLIFYIKECFCYDHITDRGSKFGPLGKRLKRKKDLNSENCKVKSAHVIQRRQEYESSNDNDQFAQIDVASFIKKPDFYAEEESLSQQEDLNSQLMPKYNDYDILSNLDVDHSKLDEHSKLKANHNPALFEDAMDTNEHNLEASPLNSRNQDFLYNDYKYVYENDISSIHNPLKKSPMQQLKKFPFFFRKKGNATRATDYYYTTSKQKYLMDFNDLMGYNNNDQFLQKDIKKRADKENTCVKCKTNKGKSKNDRRGLGKSLIHNSRQYYQKLKGDSKKVVQYQTEKNNNNKETVKTEVPIKPSMNNHKQDVNKSYMYRHKKANMHKHTEKGTKKKKKFGWKDHKYSS